MSFHRYPKYKDSGVDWLGEVPEHWEVRRIGTLFRQVNEEGNDSLPILSVSIHDGVSDDELDEKELDRRVTRSEDRSKYKRVAPGDLVYNMMRAWQGGFGAVKVAGMVSPAYVVARPSCSSITPQIERLLRSPNAIEQMRRHSRGVTDFRLRLYWEEFKGMSVVIPPTAERDALDKFLNHETSKIDALIAEQQRLIELLKEKRQAVISHAVTKGLNPNVRMKNSGVEWLGEVPEHWSVMAVRRIVARIEQGWSPECIARPAEVDEWGVVKSGCVNRGTFKESENKALPSSLEPILEYEIRAGDVLMSRASGSPDLVGSTAFIDAVRPRLMLSDKLFRITPEPSIVPKFFVASFNSCLMRSQIERAISGAEGLANNLPQSSLMEFFFAVPPVKDQTRIVEQLETETNRIDTLSAEAQRSIGLLQERRTALISAAVTGQIDVRGFQPAQAA